MKYLENINKKDFVRSNLYEHLNNRITITGIVASYKEWYYKKIRNQKRKAIKIVITDPEMIIETYDGIMKGEIRKNIGSHLWVNLDDSELSEHDDEDVYIIRKGKEITFTARVTTYTAPVDNLFKLERIGITEAKFIEMNNAPYYSEKEISQVDWFIKINKKGEYTLNRKEYE